MIFLQRLTVLKRELKELFILFTNSTGAWRDDSEEKGLCHQPWWPKFKPQHTHGRRRGLPQAVCPLTSICVNCLSPTPQVQANDKQADAWKLVSPQIRTLSLLTWQSEVSSRPVSRTGKGPHCLAPVSMTLDSEPSLCRGHFISCLVNVTTETQVLRWELF